MSTFILPPPEMRSVDTTSGNVAITLDPVIGKRYEIYNIGNGGNTVDVTYDVNTVNIVDGGVKTFTYVDSTWLVVDGGTTSLGTAAQLDTGTAPDQLPTNSDLGTAAQIDTNAIQVFSSARQYDRDVQFKVKSDSARSTLQTPSKLIIAINGSGYIFSTSTDIDLSVAASWDDTTGTDWTVAANRAGKDFYIYACEPSTGTVPDLILSANVTIPNGYTDDNSRKIGGFHCLCADIGANAADPAGDFPLDPLDDVFASHTITGNTHWLTGFLAGDVLPFSIWDLSHRPKASPEGMTFDPFTEIWIDIYLPSWSGSRMESVNGGTIADGGSSPSFHCYNFCELFPRVKKQLISQVEFQSMSIGSPQEVNIAGSADPGTTGGHSATDFNRIVSLIGVEDATGVMWQWGRDFAATNDVGSAYEVADTVGTAGSYDALKGIGRGRHYEAPNRPILGGHWIISGDVCGSRGSYWSFSALYLHAGNSARGVSEEIR